MADGSTNDGIAPDTQSWLTKRLVHLSTVMVVILAVTTLVSFWAGTNWIADLLANLRIQQIIGLTAAIVITLLIRRWRLLALELVLLGIHLPWLFSAGSGPGIVDAPAELVVMTVNVLTENDRHELILQQIETAGADVLSILELGTPLHQRLERDLAAAYPYRITVPQDRGNFGIGVYSRFPLTDVHRFALNFKSIETIAVTVTNQSQSYRIVATHPLPPMSARGYEQRNEHLRQLSKQVAKFKSASPEMSVIVMGDLNLTPWSPLFGEFESTIGLRRAGRRFSPTPTWYAGRPWFPLGLMLDHVLISDDLDCVSHQTGQNIGSDHRAVIVGIAPRKAAL